MVTGVRSFRLPERKHGHADSGPKLYPRSRWKEKASCGHAKRGAHTIGVCVLGELPASRSRLKGLILGDAAVALNMGHLRLPETPILLASFQQSSICFVYLQKGYCHASLQGKIGLHMRQWHRDQKK